MGPKLVIEISITEFTTSRCTKKVLTTHCAENKKEDKVY